MEPSHFCRHANALKKRDLRYSGADLPRGVYAGAARYPAIRPADSCANCVGDTPTWRVNATLNALAEL